MKKIFFLILLLPTMAMAKLFHVGPYLQNPGPNQMIVKWEGRIDRPYTLKYGTSEDALELEVVATKEILKGSKAPKDRVLYKAKLTSLMADKKYFYTITDGNKTSRVASFKTFPKGKKNFSFLALSDGQSGYAATRKVIKESLMPHVFKDPQLIRDFPVEMALFSGDLVQNGSKYPQWKQQYFGPLNPLLKKIPVIPAIGNHEVDHRLYFSFFDLPENGTKGFEEHWYYFDLGNVRFIGLDTNTRYRKKVQLEWLENVLEDAHKKGIDFVVGHFHHPHESELWLLGNTGFSGKIQKIMEDFSIKSEIPSVHLCGHTHGYSRGHSLRANHSMITVASIGGHLDQWGKHRQRDYLEYLVSLDQYGWVIGEVEAGVNPRLTFKRFSYGDAHSFYDMGVQDQFTIKKKNINPAKPEINDLLKVDNALKVSGLEFYDLDGDEHLTTHIQVSKNGFKSLKYEDYINYKNIYFDEDKNKDISMTNVSISKNIPSNRGYKVRIRYRDTALGWSDWSTPKDI